MGKAKKRRRSQGEPISTALRQTIRQRDLTAYRAAKDAGISVDAVQRFMNAERSLNLATVDKLADTLKLTLCPEEDPPKKVRSSP